MSAPVGPRTSHTALRAGAVAHRWAGVVGARANALCAVGVRCDEEDRAIGEALVVDLAPGRITPRCRLPFAVRAIDGSPTAPLLLDEHGGLWRLVDDEPERLLDGVVRLVAGLALTGDGRVYFVAGDAPRAIADRARGVGRGVIVVDDGVRRVEGSVVGATIPCALPATVTACHRHGDTVAVAGDKTLVLLEPGATDAVVRRLPAPAGVQSVARGPDRWLLGSTVAGLHVLEDGDDVVRALRPSLRAHQLLPLEGGGVVAVADLAIATSDDGQEWLGRDLAGLVRLLHG